ncbi:uncharacterized protein LOC141619110 [Silene latifolia]|uniref:uncharacterized protein LOC141619110 n=1 Tax=Silene latifolia TaxID=37657 RepID=UPI003D787C7F
MACITTSYTLVLNGSNFGYFKGKRGLRQGDPVSPLIFTICMDYLTRLIAFATARWPFHYHPLCKGIKLTHLMFADDLLILMVRIRSIGAKKLSYAGRVVLINSVLNTLYNYWAAMFVIPKAAIKRVETICRNFLLDSSTEYHRVHLVGWDRVDRLWIKWIDSVYLKGANWNDYTPSNDSTWTWKTICKVKEQLKNGFIDNCWAPHQKGYTIGNGYEWLMGTNPTQDWAKIVWNEWNVPKHSFNSWLIMQEGLNTKVKLFAYGVFVEDDMCVLCL